MSNLRRVPKLVSRLNIEAAAAMAETGARPKGVMELRIAHEDWCCALKPPGKWCNCEPDVSLKPIDGPERMAEIMADERQRRGIPGGNHVPEGEA